MGTKKNKYGDRPNELNGQRNFNNRAKALKVLEKAKELESRNKTRMVYDPVTKITRVVPIINCTCDNCKTKGCEFRNDPYNTNGDCLNEK